MPEDIAVSTWLKHPRYGPRAGGKNEDFLDAKTFERFFTNRLDPYKRQVGPLIFEFGTFNKTEFPTPADFMAALDPFLGSLPDGYRYAVEIRNPEYLSPAYFGLLASHNVAHVFNAHTRMPTLDQQAQLREAFTADFTVVRALLAKGRTYDQSIRAFEPDTSIKEPNEGARRGMTEIAHVSRRERKDAVFNINNRLEGFGPGTIEAVLEQLEMF